MPGRFGDSLSALQQIPSRYFSQVRSSSNRFNRRLSKSTLKSLRRLQQQEEKINHRLAKIDSVAAHNLFSNSIDSLSHLQDKMGNKLNTLANRIPGRHYIPFLDTLQTSLNFLNKYSNRLSQLSGAGQKLKNSLNSVQQLEGRLQQVEDIQQYIQERQQLLSQSLSQYGSLFSKSLGNISKEVYYYQAEIKNYKDLWSQPEKMERMAIDLLSKVPAFNKFMEGNSILASMFGSPGGAVQNLAGLQTRSQVEELLQQRMSGSGQSVQQAITAQIQQAQQALSQLKSKFPALNSNTGQMPDFQPNDLKSKTILQRLEYGANLQFGKATNFFPATSDIAAQVAYRFAKNGSAGIGSSFKLGWGSNIRKIHFTAQGLGLRSFVDWKIKGSIYVNGGYEMNYLSTIPNIPVLKDLNGWTRSALIGIERRYKISNKLNGDMVLLYDFLHNEHVPNTTPVVFRMGYNF